MRKRISSYELIDHGIDSCQYFPGCGVAHTAFDAIATGCGSNPAEAIDSALDDLAEDYELDGFLELILRDNGWKSLPTEPNAHDDCPDDANEHVECELYYYVSIRVKEGKD